MLTVYSVERARINISPEERRVVVEGMAGAIRYGTARSARLDVVPLTIVGKTGTASAAERISLERMVCRPGWSDSVARDLQPSQVQLAVIVFLPRANGAEAAKVSRPIFGVCECAVGDDGRTSALRKFARMLPPSRRRPASPVVAVSVHSVTENVTRDLPLENYVLGVMRAEGSMEVRA